MKKVAKAISFLLIFVLMFFAVQAVMIPKWRFNLDHDIEGETDRYGSFYKLPENTVDYLTVGASTSYYSLNPSRIYAETGIAGYSLGNSSQRMDLLYFLLKEALKTQHPKVVFLDASLLVMDNSLSGLLTKALVQMKPSFNKVQAASACQTEDCSAMELLFPMLQFHDRWEGLTKDDFRFGPDPNYSQCGSYSEFDVAMYTVILDRPVGITYNLSGNAVTANDNFEVINSKWAAYFEKILALCQEENIELIPTHFASIWPRGRDAIIEGYLESFGLELFNLTDSSVGLDWNQDTKDNGTHTNYWGNAKGSDYLADYLREKGFADHRGQSGYEAWDEMLKKYLQWEQTELYGRMIPPAYDYLSALGTVTDDYLIVLAVRDEASGAWNDTLEAAVQRLGVKSSFYDKIQASFVAILDQGENLFECWDDREIVVNTNFRSTDGKDHALHVASSGFVYGNRASVIIDGAEQAVNERGVNIVVIDKASGKVVSSVCIDSHEANLTLTRKTLSEERVEQWKEIDETYQLVEDGVYNIIPVDSSDFAVDVPNGVADEDANIWLGARNGLQPQEFEIRFIGDGLYTIRAVCSDKYLAVENMGSTAGSNVSQQTWTGLANQKWFITENSDGSYSFTSLYNGCKLDVENGVMATGTNIQVCDENFLPPQQFYLERIS